MQLQVILVLCWKAMDIIFTPIAKAKYDDKYITSDEYILRKQVKDYSHEQIAEMMR